MFVMALSPLVLSCSGEHTHGATAREGFDSEEVTILTEEARETKDKLASLSDYVCYTEQMLLNHGKRQLRGVTLGRRVALLLRASLPAKNFPAKSHDIYLSLSPLFPQS